MNITIRLSGDRTADVPCYRVPGVPGLVAHRPYGAARGWRLSHRSSGLAVNGLAYDIRAEAIDAGRAVGPLTDWADLPLDDLGAMRELGRRVVNVLRGGSDLSSDAPRESVVESVLPDGWELDGDDLDGLLVCPHGDTIEMDGVCPQGCVSPLRTAGLI